VIDVCIESAFADSCRNLISQHRPDIEDSEIEHKGPRHGICHAASVTLILEKGSEAVECLDHCGSRSNQRFLTGPRADEAKRLLAGLYDKATLEARPFSLAVPVRIEEGGLFAGLHPELDYIVDLHGALQCIEGDGISLASSSFEAPKRAP
jgi:hypothetical protein